MTIQLSIAIQTGNGAELRSENETNSEGDLATRAGARAHEDWEDMTSHDRHFPVEAHPARPQLRYLLNSRRLTTWHRRVLAKALGLPTTSSQDQLRQCIEGTVEKNHDYQNVVVIIRESLKTEHVVLLEDSEGEFLQSDPVYSDGPLRPGQAADVAQRIQGLCQQLEEAEKIIASATSRDEEQARFVSELQGAVHAQQDETTSAHEEMALLKKQLSDEREKSRKS